MAELKDIYRLYQEGHVEWAALNVDSIMLLDGPEYVEEYLKRSIQQAAAQNLFKLIEDGGLYAASGWTPSWVAKLAKQRNS